MSFAAEISFMSKTSFLSVLLFLQLCVAPALLGQVMPAPKAEKRAVLFSKLRESIETAAHDCDCVMAVAVTDLTSGEQILIHPDEVMPQASSIKIAILAELYRQAQAGKLKLTDEYVVRKEDLVDGSDIMLGLTPGITRITLRDLATMMVAVSDNSATNVLIDRVGMDNVNAMLNSLGLHSTRLRRKMMDLKAAGEGRENVSTAREMSTLLTDIYQGKLLNKELTADYWKMLETGSGDSDSKGSSIVRGLPGDAEVASKPGELEAVRNDSGVVFTKNRPFVISVMTTYDSDEKAAEAAISRIAARAYSYFDRVGRASDYGRVVSPK